LHHEPGQDFPAVPAARNRHAGAGGCKLALAGAEYGGDNAYYYAGLLVPFPGGDLGNGFVQRNWVDWLRYEYDNGTRTITAKAPGAVVALGYTKSAEPGSMNVCAGPVYRNTDFSRPMIPKATSAARNGASIWACRPNAVSMNSGAPMASRATPQARTPTGRAGD
jgi:Cellulose biosynthesis protein BcsS